MQAGDSSDLLTVTLDLPQPVAGAAPVDSWRNWAVGGAAGALLLAGVALAVLRRRNSYRRN